MDRQEFMSWSEDELARALLPIDDQMNNQGIPRCLRATKGWYMFVTEHELNLSFHEPASDRIVNWFRNRSDQTLRIADPLNGAHLAASGE